MRRIATIAVGSLAVWVAAACSSSGSSETTPIPAGGGGSAGAAGSDGGGAGAAGTEAGAAGAAGGDAAADTGAAGSAGSDASAGDAAPDGAAGSAGGSNDDAGADAADDATTADAAGEAASDANVPDTGIVIGGHANWTNSATGQSCDTTSSAYGTVVCANGGFDYQLAALTPCPTNNAHLTLYFHDSPPAAGTYTAHPSANASDLLAVSATEFGATVTRDALSSDEWYAQSGSATVDLVGGKVHVTFSNVQFSMPNAAADASDATTTVSGDVQCGN